MTRRTRIGLYCGALVLVFVLLALLGTGSRNRSSLQSYQAELRARGEKLTFEDLERSRSTNVNNSIAALSNAVSMLGIPQFNPGCIALRRYVSPGCARLCWKGTSPGWTSNATFDTQPTWAQLGEQITAAQPALSELREALRDPRASSGPCTNLTKGPLWNYVAVRIAAQWLASAALNEARQGHTDLDQASGLLPREVPVLDQPDDLPEPPAHYDRCSEGRNRAPINAGRHCREALSASPQRSAAEPGITDA